MRVNIRLDKAERLKNQNQQLENAVRQRNVQKAVWFQVLDAIDMAGGIEAHSLYEALLDVLSDSAVDGKAAESIFSKDMGQFWPLVQADLQSDNPWRNYRALTSVHSVRERIGYPADFAIYLKAFLNSKLNEFRKLAYEIILCSGLGTESYQWFCAALNEKSTSFSGLADCRQILASDKQYALDYVQKMLAGGDAQDRFRGAAVAACMGYELLEILPILDTALKNACCAGDNALKKHLLRAYGNFASRIPEKEPEFIELWKAAGEEEVLTVLANMGSGYALDILLCQQYEGKDRLRWLATYKDRRLTPELYQLVEDITGHVRNRRTDEIKIRADVTSGIGRLRQVSGPIADNLLNLTAQLPDYSYEYDPCGDGGSYKRVRFDEERRLALEALAARGNPPYRPEAFM
jgi:hypothetical protein